MSLNVTFRIVSKALPVQLTGTKTTRARMVMGTNIFNLQAKASKLDGHSTQEKIKKNSNESSVTSFIPHPCC